MEMNIEGFINALYGKTNSGALGVSYVKPGNAPVTKWFTSEQLDEVAAFVKKCGKRYNTYININLRQTALDACHRGESTDISEVVGLYMDYDIKGQAHAEERLPETVEELRVFIHHLPIKPSIIVTSGNGMHCYWLFEEPFQIESEDDHDYISGLLSGYEQYVKEQAYLLHHWNFDRVADLARMLRAPDTTNFKTSEKPQCRVIEASEVRYIPLDFDTYTKHNLSNPKGVATVNDDTDSFTLMGTGSGKELIDKCSFLQHCRDDAANLSEPMWYAAITNLAITADGHDVVHEISRPYPKYSYQETEAKFRHAAQEDKPVTCDHIKNHLCFNCGKNCGVRAPIALIRKDKRDGQQEWETPIPFDEYKLPKFPIDALPPSIADYAVALAEHTQTPVDMAGTCGLAVVALGTQGKYEVEAKPGWNEPTNLFQLCIMPPSERKSAVENGMLMPMNSYEAEYNTRHAAEFEIGSTVSHMLSRPEYLGHTVNFKTSRKSYKQKKKLKMPHPNGRFSRILMKLSSIRKPTTLCSVSGMVDGE